MYKKEDNYDIGELNPTMDLLAVYYRCNYVYKGIFVYL